MNKYSLSKEYNVGSTSQTSQCINRLKKKTHTTKKSYDYNNSWKKQEVFEKNWQSSMIKTFSKLEIEGYFLNLIKGVYKNKTHKRMALYLMVNKQMFSILISETVCLLYHLHPNYKEVLASVISKKNKLNYAVENIFLYLKFHDCLHRNS